MKLARFLILAMPIPVLLAAPARAQKSRIVPEYFATMEGNDTSLRPFASNAFRMQMLVDGGEVASRLALISEFAFRRDGTNRTTPYSGRRLQSLTVTIGYAATTPATMASTFAQNRKGGQTTILSGVYDLPPQPAVTPPGPFNITFKLPSPFPYVRINGDLLIEMTVPGQNTTKFQYPLDAVSAGRGTQSVRKFGGAGRLAGHQTYSVTNNSPTRLQPGGAALLDVSGFNQAYPAIAAFGFSKDAYGPLRLPFPLDMLGAPGNDLNVSLDLMLPVAMTQDANTKLFGGRSKLPIPFIQAAIGAVLYGQAILVDPASNSLGLVWSNGVEMTVTTTPISPFQTLYSDDSTAAAGFFILTGNGGLGGFVTRFGGFVFD